MRGLVFLWEKSHFGGILRFFRDIHFLAQYENFLSISDKNNSKYLKSKKKMLIVAHF